MKRVLAMGLFLCVAGLSTAMASEVGFIEDFALAPDRDKPLAQLIAGTEDYYYYNCLNLQAKGDFAKVEDLLKLWIARYQYTPRVKEIQLRQALLSYDKDPAGSLGFLTKHLNLQFNHQREILGQKPDLPTALDQALIGRDALTKVAMQRHQNLDGFEDAALESLAASQLDGDRRRDLIRRLHRPDVPGLVQLVAADLEYKNSGGFGQFEVHRLLLLAQLEDLLKAKPELLSQTAFVQAYMAKLAPGADEDWRNDPKVKAAFLDRQWAFVSRLAPAHNSLKAHVLYNRLAFDRTQGVYDKDRFDTYVKLPRQVFYINPKYMQTEDARRYPVDLNASYENITLMPPILSDEPLVRDYFMHFLLDAADYKAYQDYVSDVYLKEVFAEAKLVNGIGDPEQWYSLLPPDKVKALKERVDIDFAPANRSQFGPDEAVKLDVDVKNVPSLMLKVFEINALNFYRDNLREVGTDINLDGLVANQQKTYEFKDAPPMRRKRFSIPDADLASLKNRGVYVVELIGNGKSSRALVFKGRLYCIGRPSVAGHVLTVLDEASKKVEGAKVWMAGHEYAADKDGRITIPYTAQPALQKIVLVSGPLASLAEIRHESESYQFQVGFHVEREALLHAPAGLAAPRKATVAVRPVLTVNGIPAPLAILEEVKLVLTSVDLDGVATTKEVADFKVSEDKESTYEFSVPDRMAAISFTVKAKVKNLSKIAKEDLSASRTFALNQIDKTEKVEDLHITHTDAGYVLDLLGRSGEAKADRAVHFVIKHRDYRDPVQVSLKTDAQGRVNLGALADIVNVTATGPEGTGHTWVMSRDRRLYPSEVCGKAGTPLTVPYMGAAKEATPAEISLLETRGGALAKDWLSAVKIKDGFLVLDGLPAGDYDLLIKSDDTHISVLVADGAESEGYVNSPVRRLEIVDPAPLQIVSAAAEGDKIVIRLANATKETRVHLAATRYLPEYAMTVDLGMPIAGPFVVPVDKLSSLYISGRNIGDEYRYVIDRASAVKFPGNMLGRPGLILNPWSLRKTEAGKEVAAAGEEYRRASQPVAESLARQAGLRSEMEQQGQAAMQGQLSSDLDYLPEQAAVLFDLKPDDKGVVTIDKKDLGGHQQIRVLAVDSENTVYRQFALAEPPMKPLDLRLPKGLDPKKHFAEQKLVTALDKGEKLTIADAATARLEVYDDLASVHRLYVTLSGNATLAEFSFVTNWNTLAPEKKRELCSKYACHELNFFLSKKDPDFFKSVVKPYLENKKDKTFMDRYLVGEDLSAYLQPWMYEQLNTGERVLLGKRMQAERANISRSVKDSLDLIPPDLDRLNQLFQTALRGKVLETSGTTALALERLRSESETTALATAGGAPMNGRLRQAGAAAADGKELADKAGATDMDQLMSEEKAALKPAAALAPPPAPAMQLAKALPAGGPAGLGGRAGGGAGGGARMDRAALAEDLARRKSVEQFYRKLDKTEEWAEDNYYHLPIAEQNAALVTVSAFWNDYAAFDESAPLAASQAGAAGPARADGKKPFLSTHLAEASHNFSEMMMALAVLDLPFEAGKHELQQKDRTVTLTAGSPAVVFHKEIQEAPGEPSKSILVSQNFYRYGERYIQVGNEQVDHFITDEFLFGVAYGCQVVVTNPTSAKQKIEVLLQVPTGAIPLAGGQETRSVRLDLEPYRTTTMDYYFYFPRPGTFEHYPLHVAKEGKLLAAAEPLVFKVLEKPTKVDTKSWDYISQNGTADEVIDFLKANNLARVNLDRIAWRLNAADGKEFFAKVIPLLASRKMYNHTLWSYGLKLGDVPAIRQYLLHCDGFLSECGDWIDSKLVTIDPVLRKTYQFLEYAPLVNARAHQLGKRRQIVNERLAAQYGSLLKILAYRSKLDSEDLMSVTYYMLLQDRVEEGRGFFAQVKVADLPERIQYDYLAAYLDFYSDQPKAAREIATKYKDYGVDRWRKMFGEVLSQLDQIEGKAPSIIDEENRLQKQTEQAAKSPALDLKVESRQVKITSQNLAEVTVNYYLMDVELMFSTNPFVQQQGGQFSYIKPNKTEKVALAAATPASAPAGASVAVAAKEFALPAEFANSNVLVEVVGGGLKRSQAYYANSLAVELVENYGQIRVADEKGKALPKTYVKVYARMKDGSVAFFKDGYTDLRGRFDYASLNTDELDRVEKFSMLILSQTAGALVKEANPPKR